MIVGSSYSITICRKPFALLAMARRDSPPNFAQEFNSEADAQASRATNLAQGESQQDIAGRGYGRRGY
ncbi:hypothetical protein YC2023_029559 [Brassica napus]